MRIGIISDSHGMGGQLDSVLMRMEATGKVDWLVHLGDGYQDLTPYLSAFPQVLRLRGNCDAEGAEEIVETIGGVKLFMTHGHPYHVRMTKALLNSHARGLGARAALFGHTHTPFSGYRAGVLLLNPGAALDGRFAILTIGADGALDADLH